MITAQPGSQLAIPDFTPDYGSNEVTVTAILRMYAPCLPPLSQNCRDAVNASVRAAGATFNLTCSRPGKRILQEGDIRAWEARAT